MKIDEKIKIPVTTIDLEKYHISILNFIIPHYFKDTFFLTNKQNIDEKICILQINSASDYDVLRRYKEKNPTLLFLAITKDKINEERVDVIAPPISPRKLVDTLKIILVKVNDIDEKNSSSNSQSTLKKDKKYKYPTHSVGKELKHIANKAKEIVIKNKNSSSLKENIVDIKLENKNKLIGADEKIERKDLLRVKNITIKNKKPIPPKKSTVEVKKELVDKKLESLHKKEKFSSPKKRNVNAKKEADAVVDKKSVIISAKEKAETPDIDEKIEKKAKFSSPKKSNVSVKKEVVIDEKPVIISAKEKAETPHIDEKIEKKAKISSPKKSNVSVKKEVVIDEKSVIISAKEKAETPDIDEKIEKNNLIRTKGIVIKDQKLSPPKESNVSVKKESITDENSINLNIQKDNKNEEKTQKTTIENNKSKYISIEKDKVHFIASRKDIDLSNPRLVATLVYSADDYLQGKLKHIYEKARYSGSIKQIDTKYGIISYNPKSHKVYVDINKTTLQNIASIADLRMEYLFTAPHIVKYINQDMQWEDADLLLWKTAVWASRGRLPATSANIDVTFKLKHWPNLTRLMITPHAMEISALWLKEPITLRKTITSLKIPQRTVFSFYSAVIALDLLVFDHAINHIAKDEKETKPMPTITHKNRSKKHGGFFGKLLNYFKPNKIEDV